MSAQRSPERRDRVKRYTTLRRVRGLSLAEAAAELGVSERTCWRYEREVTAATGVASRPRSRRAPKPAPVMWGRCLNDGDLTYMPMPADGSAQARADQETILAARCLARHARDDADVELLVGAVTPPQACRECGSPALTRPDGKLVGHAAGGAACPGSHARGDAA